MAGYLVYWRTYWRDQNESTRSRGPFWVTNDRGFHAKVNPGDRIWVVIHAQEESAEWRLLRRIWVQEVLAEPSQTKWGKWHIRGEEERTVSYDPLRQPDLTPILLLLRFAAERPMVKVGAQIGKYFQSHGHRTLADEDVVVLEKYGASLKRVGF